MKFQIILFTGLFLLSGCGAAKLAITKDSSFPMKSTDGSSLVYFYSPFIDTSKLPNDIHPAQLTHTFTIGNRLFLTVDQGNSNRDLHILKKPAAWAGVLVSNDNGNSWQKFFTIKNPTEPGTNFTIHPNILAIFEKDEKLFIDIIDDRGGGSGEGRVTRLASGDDGKTWDDAGCFYYAGNSESYFKFPIEYVQYFDFIDPQTRLQPDVLKPLNSLGQEHCVYAP